jgi:hypothetical protein
MNTTTHAGKSLPDHTDMLLIVRDPEPAPPFALSNGFPFRMLQSVTP